MVTAFSLLFSIKIEEKNEYWLLLRSCHIGVNSNKENISLKNDRSSNMNSEITTDSCKWLESMTAGSVPTDGLAQGD